MNYRKLGRTGMTVSEVSVGTWAMGSQWGNSNDRESRDALEKALEEGVNFFDTADVYGMGISERLLADLRKAHPSETIYIATKAGRRLDPHIPERYTPEAIREFIKDSLKNIQTDSLDLVQLHCPPWEVYYRPEIFEALDKMEQEGLIKNYGVSVERVEEALKAVEYPGVKTVQIIFNMFRQRPLDLFFPRAVDKEVGIIVRVPLASGLLTGKMSSSSTFDKDDHRHFNRQGEMFDKGETFAGVNFESGLEAVEELRKLCPDGMTMAQFALKWILQCEAVSCIIPGVRRPSQVEDNVKASELAPLSKDVMDGVQKVYDSRIRAQVHHLW